jgi:hypothetical protein
MTPERPQDQEDLARLVATLQKLESREPGRQAIRAQLLAKLQVHVAAPATAPADWQRSAGR